jgi:hypothetical protein
MSLIVSGFGHAGDRGKKVSGLKGPNTVTIGEKSEMSGGAGIPALFGTAP